MFRRSQYQHRSSPKVSYSEGACYGQPSTGADDSQQPVQGLLEVRSSFYTNNPLLYFSHYSEIVVASGYDVTERGGKARTRSGNMISQPLTSRRELVEQLDPEPLYDYLIQNGVLNKEAVGEICQERSPAQTNLALLRKVEDNGRAAEALLVIALRQTGQHYLANLLDDSGRIKALSGSGYLSKSRHKGQLSVKLAVKAIKLPPEAYKSSSGETLHNREWLSIEDIAHHTPVNGLSSTENSVPQLEIAEPENESSNKSSCFCGCFRRIFSKSKAKNLEGNQTHDNKATKQSKGSKYAESVEATTAPREQQSVIRLSNSEKFINLENIFRQKAAEFYAQLCDNSSVAHTQLLKYFEQGRGLLVLDTRDDPEGVVIINICTTIQKVSSLRQDYNSGKLTSDLQKEIINEETLKIIKALGMKITVDCERDELDQVEQELS